MLYLVGTALVGIACWFLGCSYVHRQVANAISPELKLVKSPLRSYPIYAGIDFLLAEIEELRDELNIARLEDS